MEGPVGQSSVGVALTSANDVPLVDEELLRSHFLDWKRRYEDSAKLEMEFEKVFSASWERLWNDAWAEYDRLERVRTERGFVRQTWQYIVEAERAKKDSFRKNKSVSETLTAYELAQVPLGVLLEKYLSASIGSGYEGALALRRWRRFGEVVVERPEFYRSLSVSQKVSWTLLNH